MQPYKKLYSKRHNNVILRVVPGHFVTPNSHINYFFDMTAIMRRQSEAKACAELLSEYFSASTVVDTIVCLDGMDVIGAYLAEELTQAGILSKNAHKTMYVVSPEYDMTGQMIFRENLKMMIRDKNVLLIAASTTTGHTIKRAIDCVDYYGGTVVGAASIFSAVNKIFDVPIYSIFNLSDVSDYGTYKHENCPMCKARQKVDAIANGFGYSVLP